MANESLSLQITTKTTGTAEAAALEQQLVRIGSAAQQAAEKSAKFAQEQGRSVATLAAEVGVLIGLEKAFAGVAGAVTSTAAAYAQHHNAAETLVDGYRALRLGAAGYQSVLAGSAAPLLLTGSAVALGIAVEESVRLTLETAKLIDQQGTLAASSNLSQQEIQKLALAARLSGQETTFFTGAVKDLSEALGTGKSRRALADLGVAAVDSFNQLRPGSAILADVAQQFGKISDPAEKARLSLEIFGSEGTKFLPILNEQLSRNIEKLKETNAILDQTARRNIITFRDDLASLGNVFRDVEDNFTLFGAGLKNKVAAGLAAAYVELKQFDKGLQEFDEDFRKAFAFVESRLTPDRKPSTPGNIDFGKKTGGSSALGGLLAIFSSDTEKVPAESVLNPSRAEKDRFAFLAASTTVLDANSEALIKNRRATKDALEAQQSAAEQRIRGLEEKLRADDENRKALTDPLNKIGTPAKPPLPLDERLALQNSFNSEVAVKKSLTDRIAVLRAAEEAAKDLEKAQKQQQDAVKSADAENTQLSVRAASAGKSRIEQLDLERQASIAKLQQDVKSGPDLDRLVQDRDAQFGILLGKEASSVAGQLRTQRAQFENTVNEQSGTRTINLAKFLFGGDLAEQGEKIRKDLETNRAILEIGLNAQRENIFKDAAQSIRIAELQAQPGGEFAAAEKGFAIQKQKALELFDLDVKNASVILEGETAANAERRQSLEIAKAYKDLTTATADAERAHTIKILELQKERVDKLREAAGGVFDALTSRGTTGLSDFILGQFKVVERTIFQNAAVLIGKDAHFALPGQGTQESPNLLGKLLANTPLGLDPLKTATTANTAVTISNTEATTKLTAALALGKTGGGGGSVSPEAAAQIASGITTGFSNVFPDGSPVINPRSGSIPGLPNGVGGTVQGPDGSQVILPNTGSLVPSQSTLIRGVGLAGAAVGAGFGIQSGIQQGGVRGAGTAIASGAGASSAAITLLGLAPATGPLAPILAGVALAIPLITSLFGDPKLNRDRQINRELNDNAFREPTALSLDFNQSGNYVDRDARGLLRTSDFNNFPVSVRQPARYNSDVGGSPLDVPGAQGDPFGNTSGTRTGGDTHIHLTAQGIDSRDLIARSGDLAEAIRHGISNGQADPLVSEIRSQTRTQ